MAVFFMNSRFNLGLYVELCNIKHFDCMYHKNHKNFLIICLKIEDPLRPFVS